MMKNSRYRSAAAGRVRGAIRELPCMWLSSLLVALLAAGFLGSNAHAQQLPMRDSLQLPDFTKQKVIPPGTKISAENWQQYKDYMTPALQTMFAGVTKWTVPPGYTIEVGPTHDLSHAASRLYLDSTEKLGMQVKLVKLPTGGYSVEGYSVGMPFPNPQEPDMGIKIYYNNYYRYRPWLQFGHFDGYQIDRYFNRTRLYTNAVLMEHAHIADPGMPQTLPGGDFYTQILEILEPEQSRYTASLQIFPDDPTKIDELYAFIPALRRSLRLSTAARCAPLLGTDLTNDDGGQGVTMVASTITAQFLGKQKLLSMVNLDRKSIATREDFERTFIMPYGWPKPEAGTWEVRDVYVIDVQRLPQDRPGYCYGHRIMYLDADTFNLLAQDIYDANGRLWKYQDNLFPILEAPDKSGNKLIGTDLFRVLRFYDLQNEHATLGPFVNFQSDTDVPAPYNDPVRWGSPAGLQQIMK